MRWGIITGLKKATGKASIGPGAITRPSKVSTIPTTAAYVFSAPEIEAALVSLCWAEPAHLGKVLQKLDPIQHISQPHLRLLLQAIYECYTQAGDVDWAIVVQWLRDDQALDQFDGLSGLEIIYARPGYNALLDWYIELLQDFAAHRAELPGVYPHYFSGGKGYLKDNPQKRFPKDPPILGQALVASKNYLVRGWRPNPNQPSTISLRFYPQ
jgi:DnaB-like helicase N terminal domain